MFRTVSGFKSMKRKTKKYLSALLVVVVLGLSAAMPLTAEADAPSSSSFNVGPRADSGEFAQGGIWYQAYVDYAIAGGIINADAFPDYSKAATRADTAYIFSRALPEEDYIPQNTVKSLPDVSSGTAYSAAVFMLYRAGVLAGDDDRGTFNPGAGITRAEAAAVISRVILPDTRTSGKTFE